MDSNRAADLLTRIQTANHYITMAVFFVLDFVCFVCLLLFLLFGFCLLIDGGFLFCFILPLFLMFSLLVVVSTTKLRVFKAYYVTSGCAERMRGGQPMSNELQEKTCVIILRLSSVHAHNYCQ